MLWGQNIKVLTDYANLMRDALGLTSDRVYQWRLLLEEYGPEIVYIKGIHNTVADAVLRLEYDLSVNQTAERVYTKKVRNSKTRQRQNWMTVSKNWCELDIDLDKLDLYVGPQIGMNPESLWGLPNLEYCQIPTQTDSGIPVPIWGLFFFVFFSHAQDRPSVWGSPNWFGDHRIKMGMRVARIPELIRESPNRFGGPTPKRGSLNPHHTKMGIPESVWGLFSH
jgi:hypothetical protein